MEIFIEICKNLREEARLTAGFVRAELKAHEVLKNSKDPENRYKLSLT